MPRRSTCSASPRTSVVFLGVSQEWVRVGRGRENGDSRPRVGFCVAICSETWTWIHSAFLVPFWQSAALPTARRSVYKARAEPESAVAEFLWETECSGMIKLQPVKTEKPRFGRAVGPESCRGAIIEIPLGGDLRQS